jgi:simple sugar transport system substrate-binding protein
MNNKLSALLAGIAMTAMMTVSAVAQDRPTMGIVVKVGGVPWSSAIEMGASEKAEELGMDVTVVGPTSPDPALQVRAIEDLIAKGVDAIGILPNDEAALEPVLAKARQAGIKVISHEGPGLKNVDWNFELASVKGFGEAYAKFLAEKTGGKGEYAVYVGSLTVPLHNAWADAAIEYIKANHPDMTLVGDRYGVAESVDESRRTTLDLLAAHPNLKGVLAFGSQGPIGAGRAVEERRLKGKLHVLGPLSPGQGIGLVRAGNVDGGFMWNPAESGRVYVTMAKLALDGTEITDGMEIPGLGTVHPDGNNIVTDNLIEINAETIQGLADLGL